MSLVTQERPPFRKLFVLRPIEYVPVILAMLMGTAAGAFAMISIQNGLENGDGAMVSDVVSAVNTAKLIGFLLIAIGFGAWVMRLNTWLKS